MKEIAIINYFLGEFPWYFKSFIESCSTNPSIQFILFCDQDVKITIPENVSINKLSLIEFNVLASAKLGLLISIRDSYKLCDFKPAYGVIFSEYLTGYDFWGICDIDIIFGNLRFFITDAVLNNYDLVIVREDYPTGYFMLFRNTTYVNYLFSRSKDYKKVFTQTKHFCFDECNFYHPEVCSGVDILNIESEIESMHHLLRKAEKNDDLKILWEFMALEGILESSLRLSNGDLVYLKKYQVLLFHLINFKSNIYTRKKLPKGENKNLEIGKYHIQSNDNRHKFGNIVIHFFYEKIRPVFIKCFIICDFLISSQFLRRRTNPCKSQDIYMNDFVVLKRNGLKFYKLAFQRESFKEIFLKKSVFIKDRYYSNSLQSTMYYTIKICDDLVKLSQIMVSGKVITFKLLIGPDFKNIS